MGIGRRLSVDLLDREQDLSALSRALTAMDGGQGRIVLVTGEAGIGKTSLVRAFLDGAGTSARIVRGACEDLSVAEPLGPLRDLMLDLGLGSLDVSARSGNLLSLYADVLSACANAPEGTVLVIEDLHWADDATVDFVRFVARRIVDHRILMVVTSRVERVEARQRVRRAFADVSTDILNRVPLSRLSEAAVTALCEGSGRDAARVFQATGGNAFFVAELLRNRADELPLSIKDAILARADRLEPHARSIIDIVSVIPRRAEIEHVVAVSAAPDEAYEGIEACLDAGLLESDGPSLHFTHELAREALKTAISPLRQRALNAKLYQRLSETGNAGLSRLLHHAHGAGNAAAVAELAPRAAREAFAIGSFNEAAAFYSMAMEAIADAADSALLEEAAWSQYLVGAHLDALDLQIRAMALIEKSGDNVRLGAGLRQLARYRWVCSDAVGALETIKRAIAVLEGSPGPELARAYSALSQLHMTAYRNDDVAQSAEEAIRIAKEFGRDDILSHALNNLGMSFRHKDLPKARVLLNQSIEIGLQLDDPDHAGRALGNWMHLEYENCNFEEALERAYISTEFARGRELTAYYRYSLGMIGRAKHRLGRWDEVFDPASRGFDPDDRVPENYNFNGAIALLMHQVGAGEDIDPDLAEYLGLYDHAAAEAQRIGPISTTLAEQAWLTGENTEEAINRLKMVIEKTDLPETVGENYVWLARFSEAFDVDDFSLFAEPYRFELTGDLQKAADAWAGRNAPYDQAKTLAFGDADQRAQALQIFESLGAEPAIQRLHQMDPTLGQGKRGRPPAKRRHGLTGRQIDVLRLLDKGLTNGQIGEALFISAKTVDHHVSAILASLEAASRGEASAKGRALGLLEEAE